VRNAMIVLQAIAGPPMVDSPIAMAGRAA